MESQDHGRHRQELLTSQIALLECLSGPQRNACSRCSPAGPNSGCARAWTNPACLCKQIELQHRPETWEAWALCMALQKSLPPELTSSEPITQCQTYRTSKARQDLGRCLQARHLRSAGAHSGPAALQALRPHHPPPTDCSVLHLPRRDHGDAHHTLN